MLTYRIIYLGDGLTEEQCEVASTDLLAVAQLASSTHPHRTAEIWFADRKVAVVRSCSRLKKTQ